MSLKRNPSIVLNKLKTTENGSIITTEDCKIQVPSRFMDIGLGQIGVDTFVFGNFPIILTDGNYSVMNVFALIDLKPRKTILIEIDGIEYFEFYFDSGEVIIRNKSVIQSSDLIFNVFDEYVFKGKVPWYVDYEDIPKLFNSASKYTGTNVGQSKETIEFIVSMITRKKNDREKYARNDTKSYKDVTASKITYMPLTSPYYSIHNTLNRLAGSYFSEGVTSSLIKKTDKISNIEDILRK